VKLYAKHEVLGDVERMCCQCPATGLCPKFPPKLCNMYSQESG